LKIICASSWTITKNSYTVSLYLDLNKTTNITVIQDVTPHTLTDIHQCFRSPYCLLHHSWWDYITPI